MAPRNDRDWWVVYIATPQIIHPMGTPGVTPYLVIQAASSLDAWAEASAEELTVISVTGPYNSKNAAQSSAKTIIGQSSIPN